MAMPEGSPVVAVFTERGVADRAIEELQGAGFRNEQIRFEQQEGGLSPVATPGGLPGGLGTTGSMPPGLGMSAGTPGPIITRDESTTQGGLIGGIKRLFAGRNDARIVDELVGMGVPEEEARYYQSEFELGRTIVTVEAGDRREDALAILRSDGAYDVTTPRGTQDSNAQARTSTPNAPQGTYDANAQAGTYNPNAPTGTDDPNAQARTTTPNAPQGTDDSMARPETYDTQPRQTDM